MEGAESSAALRARVSAAAEAMRASAAAWSVVVGAGWPIVVQLLVVGFLRKEVGWRPT